MNQASQSDTFVAFDIVPVVPDDNTDLSKHARGIRSATSGNLRITTFLGNVRNTRIAANEVLLVYATRIHATGTTATGIEVLV